jgi:predicted transcriptional regulator of viral defense system
MRARQLMDSLDRWDQAGIWIFSSNTLGLMFPEGKATLRKALATHVRAGILEHVARGFYVNPRARSLPNDLLAALVPFFRPWDFNYLSLESALSEAGWISQIPSRLTLMTTGRSQTFETPYGTIEFVHTARNPEQLQADLVIDDRRALPVAKPTRALRDLKRVGRNVNLVVPVEVDDAA